MTSSSSNVATHPSSPSSSQILLHQASTCHPQSSTAIREDHRPIMIRPKPQRSSLILQQTAMASNNLASVSAELLSIRPPTMTRNTLRSQSAMSIVDAHAAYDASVNDDGGSISKSCGASHEILDIFLNKEVSSAGRDTALASDDDDDARAKSSYGVKDLIFTDSPPCRARNPMAQDAEFHHLHQLNPMYTGTAAPSPVRVEGFECNQGLSNIRSTDAMNTVQNSIRCRSYLSFLMA